MMSINFLDFPRVTSDVGMTDLLDIDPSRYQFVSRKLAFDLRLSFRLINLTIVFLSLITFQY